MTTTTITGLRAGIAQNLSAISGLRTAATVPDLPNPPIAVVLPTGITYDSAFARGCDEYTFTVIVIVGRVDERTAQGRLDAYCNPSGTSSIKTALESDKTLGGYAFDCRVTEMRNYQQLVLGDGITYLAAEFAVTVYAE